MKLFANRQAAAIGTVYASDPMAAQGILPANVDAASLSVIAPADVALQPAPWWQGGDVQPPQIVGVQPPFCPPAPPAMCAPCPPVQPCACPQQMQAGGMDQVVYTGQPGVVAPSPDRDQLYRTTELTPSMSPPARTPAMPPPPPPKPAIPPLGWAVIAALGVMLLRK